MTTSEEMWATYKKTVGNNDPSGFYEPDKFLYFVNEEREIIKWERGSWVIMAGIVPHILSWIEGPIVEIGMGESTEMFAKYAQEYDRVLYSCDIKMGGMFEVFDKPLFENHVCFINKSEEFIKGFDDFPAIVFIDGWHSYEVVKMEVDFFLSRLLLYGVMFLHDTFPPSEAYIETESKAGDVYKIRQELERNPDVDVFTWPYTANGFGLTMVMKHISNDNRKYWLKNGRVEGDK